MNEQEIGALLERATRDLTPDLESLVAGGVRRGRVRQRRRRVVGAGSALLAAVFVAGVAWGLVGQQSPGSRAIDPATTRPSAPSTPVTPLTPSPSASASSAGTTARATPARAELAVTTAEVPSTFALLAPGEVSAPEPGSGPDSAPVVDFTWNGFAVRVGVTPDDWVTGERVPDPARRCAEEGLGGDGVGPCRPGPEGTVIQTMDGTNPPIDGGTALRSVTVFRPDGWDVLVMAYNGPAKEGPVTADQPPFTLDELEQFASSDAWLR